MIKGIKKIYLGAILVFAILFSFNVAMPQITKAADCPEGYSLSNGACIANPDLPDNINVIIKKIVNAMLYVLGALSVIMLIYGGFRYTTSGGNANSVVAAKNTILYAIVGVVVALTSYAIVNFVIFSITTA